MADRQMLQLWLRYRGYVQERWSAWAAPDEGPELRRLLIDAVVRNGGRVRELGDYELEVEPQGRRSFRFTATAADAEHQR